MVHGGGGHGITTEPSVLLSHTQLTYALFTRAKYTTLPRQSAGPTAGEGQIQLYCSHDLVASCPDTCGEGQGGGASPPYLCHLMAEEWWGQHSLWVRHGSKRLG